MNEHIVGDVKMTKTDGGTETLKSDSVEISAPTTPPDVKTLVIEGTAESATTSGDVTATSVAPSGDTLTKLQNMMAPMVVNAGAMPGYGMPGADQKKKMRAKGRRQRQARKLQRRLRKGRT